MLLSPYFHSSSLAMLEGSKAQPLDIFCHSLCELNQSYGSNINTSYLLMTFWYLSPACTSFLNSRLLFNCICNICNITTWMPNRYLKLNMSVNKLSIFPFKSTPHSLPAKGQLYSSVVQNKNSRSFLNSFILSQTSHPIIQKIPLKYVQNWTTSCQNYHLVKNQPNVLPECAVTLHV